MSNWFVDALTKPSLRRPPLVIHGPPASGKTLLISFLRGYYHDRPWHMYQAVSPFKEWLLGEPLIIIGRRPEVFPGTLIYGETLRVERFQLPPLTIENHSAWIIESHRRIDYCSNIELSNDAPCKYKSPAQAYELGKQHRVDGKRLTIPYVRSVLK